MVPYLLDYKSRTLFHWQEPGLAQHTLTASDKIISICLKFTTAERFALAKWFINSLSSSMCMTRFKVMFAGACAGCGQNEAVSQKVGGRC